MAEVTPDSIFQIASGFMAAKHLFVANEVGLFTQLAEGSATLDDLTQRLGLPRRTTRIGGTPCLEEVVAAAEGGRAEGECWDA